MLGKVSSCAIVTLSLRRVVFPMFDFKKGRDLEIRVKGHSRSFFSNFVPKTHLFEIFDF